nr:MAG TPA: hypothetical protein [Caudoviricetes sp.]
MKIRLITRISPTLLPLMTYELKPIKSEKSAVHLRKFLIN